MINVKCFVEGQDTFPFINLLSFVNTGGFVYNKERGVLKYISFSINNTDKEAVESDLKRIYKVDNLKLLVSFKNVN